jgi:hypothetical protein
MQQQAIAGAIDPEAAWTRFRALAIASEQVALPELAIRFSRAPARDRVVLAGAVAEMLAPVEWPSDWQEARWQLINALDKILSETDGFTPESFPSRLALQDERHLQMVGWSTLESARNLLRTPCRRDELRVVARLCNTGNTACTFAYRKAMKRLGSRSTEEPIAEALRRYSISAELYATAARALNETCGSAIFEPSGARIGETET